MPEVKSFTYAQVKEHNNEKDVWIVVRDKVYDVTKFLKEVRFFLAKLIIINRKVLMFLFCFDKLASWW